MNTIILRNLITMLFLGAAMVGCGQQAEKAAADATNNIHQTLDSAKEAAKSTEDAAKATAQAVDAATADAAGKVDEITSDDKK